MVSGPAVQAAWSPTGSDDISTVAICAGSGSGVLKGVKADLYLTGEMGHVRRRSLACPILQLSPLTRLEGRDCSRRDARLLTHEPPLQHDILAANAAGIHVLTCASSSSLTRPRAVSSPPSR